MRLTLAAGADELAFESDWLRGTVGRPDFALRQVALKQPFEGEFSLAGLAEMYVILKGLTASLPFLIVG